MSIDNLRPSGKAPGGSPVRGAPHGRSEDFRAALGRSRMAAIAFFAELLILVGIVALVGPRIRLRVLVAERSTIQVFRVVLFVAAAASVLLARITNGRMLARARAAGGEGDRLIVLNRAALSTLASAMVPAVIGFLLYLFAGQVRDFYMLAFVSLLLLFFYFPRPASWEAVLEDRPPTCPL